MMNDALTREFSCAASLIAGPAAPIPELVSRSVDEWVVAVARFPVESRIGWNNTSPQEGPPR